MFEEGDMSDLGWIVSSGVAMSVIALIGGITLVLRESAFARIVLPLVAFAAGSLLGGAMFHMLPEGIAHSGNAIGFWIWIVAGFSVFLVLEQFLHWHHCHRSTASEHRPLTWLILIADGVHNFIGGLAVGGAFMIDTRVGIMTWLAAAAHELPQELGDFGILVHGGWSKRGALLFNFLSALTFLIGGVIAWAVSFRVDVAFLLPFAAGNFIYIAAADLIPEINKVRTLREGTIHFTFFALGIALLLGLRIAFGG